MIFREEDRDTFSDNIDINVFSYVPTISHPYFPRFFSLIIREHPNGSIGSARLN